MFQWRRFQFFDKNEVKGEGVTALQKLVITCSTSGRGKIIFGDGDGFLNIVERDFVSVSSFQAYERSVALVHQLKDSPIVISVGDDEEGSIAPVLKIWNWEKQDKTGAPLCLKQLKLQNTGPGGVPLPVTCMSVMEDLSVIAVGLCNGDILLIKAASSADATSSSGGGGLNLSSLHFRLRDKANSSKQVVLKTNASNFPVTALAFRPNYVADNNNNTTSNAVLFAATTNSVCAFYLNTGSSAMDKESHMEVLDDFNGCGVGCAVMSDEDDLLVGRSEAVYFYEAEGRGPCFAFEGDKKILSWFRSYLLIVGQDPAASTTTASSSSSSNKLNTFSIYDLKNKFIAYSENRFQNITQVVSEWGSVYLLSTTTTTTASTANPVDGSSQGPAVSNVNKIWQLEEKDTSTKLETLFKKNLYSVAINLAHSQNYDYASIMDIFRRYGDHLYSKGDYDGAIAQYVRTIGHLEPSYVIRKFLDAQRIHNLTTYLQALHEKGLANADHTTLLFNCYTKLKDVKKLDHFIKTDMVNFEIETAIKACRQAGYYSHALYLAQKHEEHDWYLKILLEDMHSYDEALQYIATLPFFDAERNLKKYGKPLVTHLPQQTTNLLIRLCTNYTPTPVASSSGSSSTATATATASSPPSSSAALSSSPPTSATPLESLFSGSSNRSTSSSSSTVKAVADEFIHLFVNVPAWLIVFLEHIVKQQSGATASASTSSSSGSSGSGGPSPVIYTTLLHLYLTSGNTAAASNNKSSNSNTKAATTSNNNSSISSDDNNNAVANENRRKAFDLLTNPQAKFDSDSALVLCKMHGFREGLLYLYEKLALYHEIVQYYMDHEEHDNIIRACKKYGDKDPSLWVQVLSYFVTKEEGDQPNAPPSHQLNKEIIEVLSYIDRDNLLPPLLVVQILSAKSSSTLGLVKDYITRRLQQENQLIQEDARQIRNYKEETNKMRNEITELKTSAKIFQLNKCTYCASPLDLPAVHFLCMHSFHQRCLGENEAECPVCAAQNRKIWEIKKALQDNAAHHDSFFKQLERSVDGFSTVADFFSRGVFSSHSNTSNSNKPPGNVHGPDHDRSLLLSNKNQ